ncbi:MAG: tetratricopeptide repeat protein [Bacteroidales bacterium]|nr:tetratricopeptide repeat protein [Bacteroidales bacterium]
MDKVIALNCPGCNQPVSTDQVKCRFCKRPIVVQKISEIQAMPAVEMTKYMNVYKSIVAENPMHKSLNGALAVCYINMKMYDKALEVYDKIMDDNIDNPDMFFNTAVCHLRGKKPFQCQRADIDAAIKYVNVANSMQPNAMNHLLLSYIKQDYFERKYLQINPSWQDELENADSYGANETIVKELSSALNVQLPEVITKRFEAPAPSPMPILEPAPEVPTPTPNAGNDSASSPSVFSSLFGRFKRR